MSTTLKASFISVTAVLFIALFVLFGTNISKNPEKTRLLFISPKVTQLERNKIKLPLKRKIIYPQYKPNPDVNCIVTIPEKYMLRNIDEPISIPNEEEFQRLPLHVITCLYHRYVTSLQEICAHVQRIGRIRRAGWNVCAKRLVKSKGNCTALLSNKKFNEKFFKRELNSKYKCRSEAVPLSYNNSLKALMSKISKSGSVDILTLSIDNFSDLKLIDNMIKDKSVLRIKQLLLELHFDPGIMKIDEYSNVLRRLKALYKWGMRLVWYDRIETCITENKFNRCYALTFVQMHDADKQKPRNKMTLPSEEKIRNMTKYAISNLYYRTLTTIQILCQQIVRIGRVADGGWDVCHDNMLQIKQRPCIVYSFGIANDFSFDDGMAQTYNCNVFSFDPTINRQNHKHSKKVWFFNRGISNEYRKYGTGDLVTFKQIRQELGHSNTPIAVLKMDVESNEWLSIPNMLQTGQLKDVSQFCLEFHGVGRSADELFLLKEIQDAGFRLFWYHQNPACTYTYGSGQRTQCMEVYFLNTRSNYS